MKFFHRSPSQHLDFLGRHHKRRLSRRWKIGIAIVAGLIFLLGLAIGLPAWRTMKAAKTFQHRLIKSQQLSAAQRYDEATRELNRAEQALNSTRSAYRPLLLFRRVPVLGRNVAAGQQLVNLGDVVLRAGRRLVGFSEQVIGPFAKKKGGLTYSSLSIDEREQLLRRLGEAEPTLLALESDLRELLSGLEDLPASYLQRRVSRELEPVRRNLELGEEALRRAAPIARVLPSLMGHNTTKTYLFLLQNNSELRPTGGFIGTYGIIKIRNGEITSFSTENSYNLDDRVKGKLFNPPPAPLRIYNSTDALFFRDSNWSPDFRVSAAKAVSLYAQEGGREKFDGVLAVTPTFIESLLGLTGVITVDGTTFTPENFRDTLQDQVTFSFSQRGVDQTQRKEVIGEMGKKLMADVFALPQEQWRDLWEVLLGNLIQKQMLLQFNDPELQRFAEAQSWAGALATPADDNFMIVDANLASLKTDPVMERVIDYALDATGEQPRATLTITYRHTAAEFTKKITRYRTYVRFYVPKGSTLIESSGADATDRSTRTGTVTTEEELEHTVFGAFKSIEPGTTEQFRVTYALPQAIQDQITGKHYRLLAQKQPGTTHHGLKLKLTFPSPARVVQGIDNPGSDAHTEVSIESDLLQDRLFEVALE